MPKKKFGDSKKKNTITQEKLWACGRQIPPLPKELLGSQLTDSGEYIASNNYLQRDLDGKITETSKEMFWRVAHNVATADLLYSSKAEVKKARDNFYRILANLEFVPNTPTFANAAGNIQQLSGCFVLPVEDSMEGIGKTFSDTIMIHKSGGGTGFSFSRLRPFGSIVRSTGRRSSGAMYFMWMYADATDRVQQGGYRRGANMGVMRVDHPDILRWIMIKSSEFTVNSFNLSVAITDKFMEQMEKDLQFTPDGLKPQMAEIDALIELIQKNLNSPESNFHDKMNEFEKNIQELKKLLTATQPGEGYELINPNTKGAEGRLNARKVFELIGRVAWEKGDPGVIFIDQINDDNPTPLLGEIEATNPCIVGSTLVATEKGLIPIKELVKKKMELKILTDNRVLGGEGVTLRSHNHLWDNGVKEVWRLQTKSGFELLATPDHKIMTTCGWKPMRELKPGKDQVLIQGGEGTFNGNKALSLVPQNKRLNLPNQWSLELGQVLGWLVGDGWLRKGDKNCRTGFTFAKEDKKIIEYFQPILNRWYGRKIKAVERDNGVWHLSYHSQVLVEFFEKLGVKPVKADGKEVPVSLFTAPKEAVIGFLQGLFSADGTIGIQEINNSKYIRLTAKSKKLLQQVQLLLLNLGIAGRIYNRSRPPRKVFHYTTKKGQKRTYVSDGVCFELHLGKTAVPLFLNKIGFLEDKHYQKVERLKKMGFYPQVFTDIVAKLEPAGKTHVYDLTEQISSSFIANGMVISNCGEQPLLPYESCNLGAINLARMVKNNNKETFDEVDWEKIAETVHQGAHFLDNVIDMNRYPLPEFEKMTKGNRKVGMGVMGWADMLVQLGIPYDSQEALDLGGKLMSFIREEARYTSMELAKTRGVFPNFKGSIYDKKSRFFKGEGLRLRNATLTTIAPTGTTSILADASSGIEPYFAIRYEKNLVSGDKMVNLNPFFVKIAKQEGFWKEDLVEKIKENKGSLRGLKEIPEKIQKIFLVAADLSYETHIKMQAAFQKSGVDNAVSKTINMSPNVTYEDVIKSYLLAYEEECKGITIYRDRSRNKQILERDTQIREDGILLRKINDVRYGRTWSIHTPLGKLHATINEDDDGNPYEIFFNVGKAGGDILAVAEGLGRLISLTLRTTPPKLSLPKLKMIVEQIEGIGGSSSVGFGLKKVRSLPDAVAKVIGYYLEEKQGQGKTISPNEHLEKSQAILVTNQKTNHNGNICPECGNATLVYEEGCEKCVCGYSKC